MSETYSKQKYDSLSAENIEAAVSAADRYLTDNGIASELKARHRRLLERILQTYGARGEDRGFSLACQRKRHSVSVTLQISGEPFDVLTEAPELCEPLSALSDDKPAWSSRRGSNRLCYSLAVPVPDKQALKIVMKYMKEERGAFWNGLLLRFVNMLVLVAEPLLAASIITAVSDSEIRKLLLAALLMLAAKAGSSLLTFFGTRQLEKAYFAMLRSMQLDMAEKTLQVKTEHIDAKGTGVFMDRILEETTRVTDGIDVIVWVVTEAFRLISLLVAFAMVSATMLLFEIALFLVYFFIVRAQSKKITEDTRRQNTAKEKLTGIVGEMIKSSRDIKLLHCEDSFLVKVGSDITTHSQRLREKGKRSSAQLLARTQFVAWTDFLYLAVLAILMVSGLSPATALILYNYNGRTFDSARAVASATGAVYGLLLSAERVYQLIESVDFSKEEFGSQRLDTVKGDIRLRDIFFAYKNEGLTPTQVLKGLSLHIGAGQSAALIGRSGCGKSTVLSLIDRLYDPDSGSIQIDGVESRELDRDTLRSSIGVVSQTPYLFNMSIRDNFAVVRRDVTDEEIIRACETACVHEDIMQLPDGYDTVVGEGAVMLSGGQRQRIALARALLQDYPVIMLDEATSALDGETQSKISEAIENMHGKRTVVMIAHRLSTVIHCERLFYLADGRVLAEGTHEELLESCPEYQKLYAEEYGC